jgi:hypothetical protein
MNAAVQSIQTAVRGDATASRPRLDPNFRYLRITIEGRVAFLALGNTDGNPNDPIEVWYSALREVVRLQNGRLVGVVGFATEWRNVSVANAPRWSEVASGGQPAHWIRLRDVMPGYRFGMRDELELRVISAPRSELRDADPKALTWFEERTVPERRDGYFASLVSTRSTEALPPARYAVDFSGGKELVVYGEQCIAPDTCFTWQRWSAEQQNKAAGG